MRKTTIALALTAILTPLAARATTPETDEGQAAKWTRLAEQIRTGPCPTEIEVLPYQWIEPTTGMEYTMLRLHCPGRDELEGETPATPGAGDGDERIPASVRSSS